MNSILVSIRCSLLWSFSTKQSLNFVQDFIHSLLKCEWNFQYSIPFLETIPEFWRLVFFFWCPNSDPRLSNIGCASKIAEILTSSVQNRSRVYDIYIFSCLNFVRYLFLRLVMEGIECIDLESGNTASAPKGRVGFIHLFHHWPICCETLRDKFFSLS